MKSVGPFRLSLFAAAALVFGTGPARAAEAPRFAWGKAGISYEQYRNDAYDCAMVGLGTNIDDSKPVETLRTASRQLEVLDGKLQAAGNASDPVAAGIAYANDVNSVRAAARPEQQVEAIKQIVFPVIQHCLVERGYTRIALTDEQRAGLADLKEGSRERRLFLYNLASDAHVLEAQKRPLAK